MSINEIKREQNVVLRSKDDEIEELTNVITQENQLLQEKDMELQSHRMELDSLRKQLQELNSSTLSSQVSNLHISSQIDSGPREGWLEIPSAKGIGRAGGWVRTFVVLAEKKLIFYAGLTERKSHQPKMMIDLEKVRLKRHSFSEKFQGLRTSTFIYEKNF